MIVDPYTGEPISITTPAMASGSLLGATSMSAAAAYGYEQTEYPAFYGMLENLPGATQTMGWNMMRGSRTIRHGGRRPGRGGGAIRNHNPFNPRMWSRFSDARMLSNSTLYGSRVGGYHYSPFNAMSRFANWGANKAASRGHLGNPLYKRAYRAGLIPDGYDGTHRPSQFFGPGTLSRISAASTIRKQGMERGLGYRSYMPGAAGRRSASAMKQRANALNFIQRTDPRLYTSFMTGGSLMEGPRMPTASQLSDLTLMSGRGTVSNYIGGYVSGVTNPIDESITRAAEATGKASFISGRAAGTGHLGLGYGGVVPEKIGFKAAGQGFRTAFGAGAGSGAKFSGAMAARGFAKAAPVLGPLSTAWMVYDLVKMGGAAMVGGVRLARDAAVSLRGSINKQPFGMGYQDNAVAATSRARGVMAIQNSRLNARSVLGSEAGMVAAHFG